MDCAGDDEQLLVVALELLVGILAEIAGMGILAVNEEDCALDFTGILLMEKYLFRRSNAALAPPLRQAMQPWTAFAPIDTISVSTPSASRAPATSFRAVNVFPLLLGLPLIKSTSVSAHDSIWRRSRLLTHRLCFVSLYQESDRHDMWDFHHCPIRILR